MSFAMSTTAEPPMSFSPPIASPVIRTRVSMKGLRSGPVEAMETSVRIEARFARRHRIDPRLSIFITATRAHETMAQAIGVKALPHDRIGAS